MNKVLWIIIIILISPYLIFLFLFIFGVVLVVDIIDLKEKIMGR